MVGSRCGLTPDQVLDMNMDTLQAVIEGYQDRLFDQRCMTVHQGYWAGYYMGTRHAKPVSHIIETMIRANVKAKRSKHGSISKPSVDMDVEVEAFLEMERRRLSTQT